MFTKFRILLFMAAFMALGTIHGCKKGGCNVIPNVNFIEIVSLVQYPQLHIPQQAVAIDRGGVAGLVVINLGNGEYAAYDRCSTVNPEKGCAVEVMTNGLVAKDPCSEATYILTNGSPASLATCPLKPYIATRKGETIVITN